MKSIISRLDLSAMPQANDGLLKGSMIRITEVVAITGPNGAGKSRLLKRLPGLLEHISVDATYPEALQTAQAKLARDQEQIARFKTGPTEQEELRLMLLNAGRNESRQASAELSWLNCFQWADSY